MYVLFIELVIIEEMLVGLLACLLVGLSCWLMSWVLAAGVT